MIHSGYSRPTSRDLKRCYGSARWMVTFADLMALLLALFVLMLTFSEVKTEKFHKNTGPMRKAFNVSGSSTSVLPSSQNLASQNLASPDLASPDLESVLRRQDMSEDQWKYQILQHLRTSLHQEIDRMDVALVEKSRGIVIRFPDRTAFSSGQARLKEQVKPILDRITEVLAETRGQIAVSGHTDDIPISTIRFRSNWDLSTSRAVSVVHRLLGNPRISPGRITAQGFADSRRLAPNDSPENRALNRRVDIEIKMPEKSK